MNGIYLHILLRYPVYFDIPLISATVPPARCGVRFLEAPSVNSGSSESSALSHLSDLRAMLSGGPENLVPENVFPRGFAPSLGAQVMFYHAPTLPPTLMQLVPAPPPAGPKIHQKKHVKTNTYWGALLVTRAAQKEYSDELGSQNDSKMEPKMEPRQQRPILTKHAPA